MNVKLFPLKPPQVVAIAIDKTVKPTNPFVDGNLPIPYAPWYGQDLTFETGRTAPHGQDVGKTEVELIPKMEKLLGIFASDDKTGMAKRLFTKFLAGQSSVIYFDDPDLNAAAAGHSNIIHFIGAALSAPGTPFQSPGKIRIHQALKQASWDINKIQAPTDLGVPAFNKGSKAWSTEDFANGLGLMINGVQYVYVIATKYGYDSKKGQYGIALQYRFYDVFGLDDEDLEKFGATSDGILTPPSKVGITAWWQLQHQHGFAPLVTRIVLERTFEVSAV